MYRWTTSGYKKNDKVPNAQIRELCRDKRIDEGVLQWFSQERMENDRIAKRVK